MEGYRIVLTADRTLMSDYGRALFLGFLSPAPKWKFFHPWILYRFVIKKVGTQGIRALQAPQGLRRIEAALIQSGIHPSDLILCPPWKLSKAIGENTRLIGISAFDPLGMGPASTTFAGEYGAIPAEPHNKYQFRKLVRSKIIQDARSHGALLIVGGPGSWQFDLDTMREYGIDLVIQGEAELVFPRIAQAILRDSLELELPAILKVSNDQAPSGNEIPLLRGATIGGLVEISRGCGRGCSFCIPTLQRLRHRPLDDIIKDAQTNISQGQNHICLVSEDVFQYGGNPLRKNPEAVLNLFRSLIQVPGLGSLGFAHANLASIVELRDLIPEISSMLGLNGDRWLGFQTGIETGSPKLISKLMRYKSAPYPPEKWKEIVIQGFGICDDNGFVPCATLIVNLPGETQEDVLHTIDLVEDLKEYRSLMVPLLYVPSRGESTKPMRLIKDAQWYHLELYKSIWKHDMKWLPDLARDYLSKANPLTKLFGRLLVKYILRYANSKVMRYLDELIERRMVSGA